MNPLRSRRPFYLLLSVTISLAAGIGLSYCYPDAPSLPQWASVSLASASCIFWLFRRPQLSSICLCISFLLFGFNHGVHSRRPTLASDHISTFISQKTDAVIICTLQHMVTGDNRKSKALVAVHRLQTATREHLTPCSGLVLLILRGPWPRTIMPGDTIAVRSRLSTPAPRNTPGTFDYRKYLAAQDIHVIGSIASPLLIRPVDSGSEQLAGSLFTIFERLRTKIGYALDDTLTPRAAALYRALLIGDKTQIDETTLEAFKGAGVMHILAISGMHMALLGVLLFQTTYWLLRRSEPLMLAVDIRKPALLLCIPLLLTYALLAGGQPPVVRAVLMSLLVIVALQVNRRRSPSTILACAAFALLIYDPRALERASFQLSFAAVTAIILVGSRYRPLLTSRKGAASHPFIHSRIFKWTGAAVLITSAATLGTAPLLLLHFNRISLIAIPANLMIEPLICLWSLPLGLLAIPLLFFSPTVASLLLQTGAVSLNGSVKIALLLTQPSWTTLRLPDPDIWMVASYYLCFVLLFAPHVAPRIRSAASVGLLASMLLFLSPLFGLPSLFKTHDQVSFIDIGHGSASLIELAGGRTILIDGGGKTAPGFDCGADILAPFLFYRKIASLDDIVITHEDADHYNGIPTLIRDFRPKRIWLPYLNGHKSGYKRLCTLAREKRIQLITPSSGTIIEWSSGRLMVIKPPHDPDQETFNRSHEDDHGLVLKLETATFSVLFPGDISKKRELELIASTDSLPADVLLSPHHGSATSNSPAFLAAVQPRYLIVSSSDWSKKLFPAPATRAATAQQGIALLTTEENGTIALIGTGRSYILTAFQSGKWKTVYDSE